MHRSQAIKASAKLTKALGLMFKLNKHVDLIAAKFAAVFLTGHSSIVAITSLFRAGYIFIILRGEIKQFMNMFTF